MNVTANCYLNKRIGSPDTAAKNPGYISPGSQVTIDTIVRGMEIEGNCIWYKASDGYYYWSGGFTETEFRLPKASLSTFTPFDQMEILATVRNFFFNRISGKVNDFTGLSITRSQGTGQSDSDFQLVIQVSAGSPALVNSPFPDGLSYKGIYIPVAIVEGGKTKASYLGSKIKRDELNEYGTSGFYARSVVSSECYIVTNYHVLCRDFLQKKIFQITPENSGNKKVICNGSESGFLAFARLDFFNDVALVKTTSEKTGNDNDITGIGRITGILPLSEIKKALANNEDTVVKIYGAYSLAVRRSEVVSCFSSQPISYMDGDFRQTIYDLIQVNKFSEKGDSGAPVVDGNHKLIGILVADDDKYSYVIPIERILSNFKIKMP
jgi:hypothetical protein